MRINYANWPSVSHLASLLEIRQNNCIDMVLSTIYNTRGRDRSLEFCNFE